MGGILSRLNSDPNPLDVFLDFEKCKPAEGSEEEKVYNEVSPILERSETILAELEAYKGCGELIRKAINTPGQETEMEAWEKLLPMVEQLKGFFEYSTELETAVPSLLKALCTTPDAEANLMGNQSLTHQLAKIFNFVLRFDDAKMTNPAIQNDFSYYRRTLNKMKMQAGGDIQVPVKDELANKMSLFYAYPAPMMKCLSETTVTFVNTNQATIPRENVTNCFAMMSNACYSMVATKKFPTSETNLFCLRAMTASIIVFDHTDMAGAFCKKSPIHMKPAINTLKNYAAEKKTDTEALINVLRFTSVHKDDDDTPNAIKNLLQ